MLDVRASVLASACVRAQASSCLLILRSDQEVLSGFVFQQLWSSGLGGLEKCRFYDADFEMQSIVATDVAPIFVILRAANMHVRAGRLCVCLVFPPSLLPHLSLVWTQQRSGNYRRIRAGCRAASRS